MKQERFKRTKSVMASGAIALVIAALTFGVSSLVLGPRSASPAHPGFDLTSGSSSFTITSNVYASPACSGSTVSLSPNTTDCAVFTVQNLLNVPITVQSITTAFDTIDYPAPPADCSGSNFTLPTFSGSLTVGGGGSANSPGVPIELIDNGAPQTDCESYIYHFTYTGGAQYTDSTSTALTSTPNPSTSGQSVTFTATVTAANPSTDASLPSGTVSFYSCPTSAACATSGTNLLGSGSIGTGGKATFSTSALTAGSTTYVEAVYPASGTDFTGSTSNVVVQVVGSSSTKSTNSTLTSSPNPSNYGSSVSFIDTVTSSSGTPTGSVTFYNCTTSACTTKTSLGTQTLSSGKATYSSSSLPVGTTYVEAIYGGSGTYGGSTSNVVTQVVKAVSTSTALTSAPDPSVQGSAVTLTATVTKSSGSGTPSGTVSFHLGSPTGTLLGSSSLNPSAQAAITTSTLPLGSDNLYAVYAGSTDFSGSTSPLHVQVVVGLPTQCSGTYPNVIFGNPFFPLVNGTNGADFIYAVGASYWINGFNGNDCIEAGDGNNLITDGEGNDTVVAGNGDNAVIVGNGNDKISLGNGSDGVYTGNGNDTVTLGNGSKSGVVVGNGADSVTVGSGSYNEVDLGHGTDTVTISGSHDAIDGGAGNETIYLGSGTYNTYDGQAHHTNTCHLPKPPSSWHGTTAAYYHDTITNCTVVSP